VGVALGLLAGWKVVGTVAEPLLPDRQIWHVVSPIRTEGVSAPELVGGTHIVDGALTITPHVFFQADTVVCLVGPIHAGELTVAEDSGPVEVHLGSEAFSVEPGTSRFWIEEGRLRLERDGQSIDVGRTGPGDLELTSGPERRARVESIRLDGADGVLLEQDFRSTRASILPWLLAGGTLGAVAGLLGSGGLWGLPLLALAFVAPETWLTLGERLYLSRTPTHELARLVLGAAAVPVILAGFSRALDALPRLPRVRETWVLAALVAAGLASRQEPWMALVGVPVLLFQPLLLRRSGALRMLKGDLPALLAVAVLGWGWGLLVLALWRLARLVAEDHAERHPRAAADHLLLHVLLLPIALELGVRSTYLEVVWDWGRISQESYDKYGWRNPVSGWSSSCGEGPTVVFAGGSSTGGAYQFGAEPEAFFPAQTHEALCERGVSLSTVNHGFSDRDTFTISRTIDILSEDADLLVLYVGVNDVLTRNHAQTRKQREAAYEARTASTRGLLALARSSRLVTGLGLGVRPVPDREQNPSSVPLLDAEENLRLIAATGVPLVLVTEYVSPDMAHSLDLYLELCERLAAELEGVWSVDVRSTLTADMLVDRNHLSREGNHRLGLRLADELDPLLTPDGRP